MDMVKESRRDMTYHEGSVKYGIERIGVLLKEAKRMGIPRILIQPKKSYGSPLPLISSLVKDAGTDALCITKRAPSGFTSTEFRKNLESERIETLVIGGFNRVCCVRATVKGALKKGYLVMTSDQIMFGHRFFDSLDDGRIEIEKSIDFFRKHTQYYDTLEGLLTALELRAKNYK